MNATTHLQALFTAAETGDVSRLKQLLHERPELANAENEQGLTVLGYAAHYGHLEAVRVLLEHGAEVNALSHSQISYIPSNTALHAAIAGERNLDVIRLLLESGAKTDIFDSNGHTCLHTAAFHADNREIVRLLLSYGAPVQARREGGQMALELAEARGHVQVAALLREHGAASPE